MANKKTQREWFADAIEVATQVGREDLVEFFKERIAVLDNKTANRKPTKEQVANAELAEKVYAVLAEAGKGMTLAEIKATDATFAEFTPQKMTGLVKILGTRVRKDYDKKTAYFTAV